MIELPEALTLGRQLQESVVGRRISKVCPPSKPHKFCWFSGDAADYDALLKGASVTSASGFGIFAEMAFDNGLRLCVNDGVNLRLTAAEDAPKGYQLQIAFEDGQVITFTVAMYGGIMLHDADIDNSFYLRSKTSVSPLDDGFPQAFDALAHVSKPTLSLKALLATEQHIPGLGNGVLQDILFSARLNPKQKLQSLDEAALLRLRQCTADILRDMTGKGGRDTEKDLFGHAGGYQTIMSRNNTHCPVCGSPIVKEAYMGGSVYYCPVCQPAPISSKK